MGLSIVYHHLNLSINWWEPCETRVFTLQDTPACSIGVEGGACRRFGMCDGAEALRTILGHLEIGMKVIQF